MVDLSNYFGLVDSRPELATCVVERISADCLLERWELVSASVPLLHHAEIATTFDSATNTVLSNGYLSQGSCDLDGDHITWFKPTAKFTTPNRYPFLVKRHRLTPGPSIINKSLSLLV